MQQMAPSRFSSTRTALAVELLLLKFCKPLECLNVCNSLSAHCRSFVMDADEVCMPADLPDDAPRPRQCLLRKWPEYTGYGFNLRAEKGKPGQFIGTVEEGSPAKYAGLRDGDRIVEVNGTNIANENHKQVVQRIKAVQDETCFLVVDQETDEFYKLRNIVVRGNWSIVHRQETPSINPAIAGEVFSCFASAGPFVGKMTFLVFTPFLRRRNGVCQQVVCSFVRPCIRVSVGASFTKCTIM